MMVPEKQIKDRRVQKTLALLHEGPGALIPEKPYDEIVGKENLNRAHDGRLTFLTHYRDKDELLASAIHEMLRGVYATEFPTSGKRHERIIRFSFPVFEHIHRHRQAGAAGMGTHGRAIIHQHLRKVLAELIADDVGKP